MAASVQLLRPQNRDLGMVMREVDEDLAIFLGMRSAKNEGNDHPVLGDSDDEFDESKGWEPKSDSFLPLNASQEEIEMSDYNWLVTQPDSSLLPTIELENTREKSASRSDGPLHQDSSSTSTESSLVANKRPLSSASRKPTPRAETLAARSTFPTKSKPSRASTPTSRPTLPSSSSSSKPESRSSTPTRVITSRSLTPSRPSLPIVSKPALRSATPTRNAADRSSSGRETAPTIIPKSSKPTDMPNKRPVSASRGRVNKPATSDEKPRRQKLCSSPKVRAPNISGGHKTGIKMMSLRSRVCINEGGEDVNPILMGTKMVDRVVNMRKLAPPKQDEYVSNDNPMRKSSHENSGFGRSLSKKSLDMAIRHMDIRRSISDKLRSE